MSKKYNIVFSFDTTGSMSGCIGKVRTQIKSVINNLFDDVPEISIGLIAHGDYCYKNNSYLMKFVDITKNREQLISFIETTGNTGGGDFPEAYEYVLRESQKLSWDSDSMRALVMIGDATPHEKDDNPEKIDWRYETKEIASLGINIYSVQCLNSGRSSVKTFYKTMASLTNGYHLYLDQFNYIVEMMKAICFNQMGKEQLLNYEQKLEENLTGLSPSMRQMFDVMLGRKTTEQIEEINESVYHWTPPTRSTKSVATVSSKKLASKEKLKLLKEDEIVMKPVRPSRFQLLEVNEDLSIKEFVSKNDLVFQSGKGFYEFTKPELIQETKEIILQDKTTGLMYEGYKARQMLGLLDYDASKKIKPTEFAYKVFIQSTSHSRKLVKDSTFLYDTEE